MTPYRGTTLGQAPLEFLEGLFATARNSSVLVGKNLAASVANHRIGNGFVAQEQEALRRGAGFGRRSVLNDAANKAFRAGETPTPVLPREGTWVMNAYDPSIPYFG
jgi:hypothetical protein